ncbi:hypothetical protein R3P38DRAFT_3601375 [Favolaschia claudopus]|uniref:Uncharacterized protein n=1 Tax=Favolaschia claudopus TaxID=2862362 RepID=A0AAW0ADH8_9AGAR
MSRQDSDRTSAPGAERDEECSKHPAMKVNMIQARKEVLQMRRKAYPYPHTNPSATRSTSSGETVPTDHSLAEIEISRKKSHPATRPQQHTTKAIASCPALGQEYMTHEDKAEVTPVGAATNGQGGTTRQRGRWAMGSSSSQADPLKNMAGMEKNDSKTGQLVILYNTIQLTGSKFQNRVGSSAAAYSLGEAPNHHAESVNCLVGIGTVPYTVRPVHFTVLYGGYPGRSRNRIGRLGGLYGTFRAVVWTLTVFACNLLAKALSQRPPGTPRHISIQPQGQELMGRRQMDSRQRICELLIDPSLSRSLIITFPRDDVGRASGPCTGRLRVPYCTGPYTVFYGYGADPYQCLGKEFAGVSVLCVEEGESWLLFVECEYSLYEIRSILDLQWMQLGFSAKNNDIETDRLGAWRVTRMESRTVENFTNVISTIFRANSGGKTRFEEEMVVGKKEGGVT